MESSDAARRAGMKVSSIETVGTINPTVIATIDPWGANELNTTENSRGSGNARSRPIHDLGFISNDLAVLHQRFNLRNTAFPGLRT
jgi:hypothetical protein